MFQEHLFKTELSFTGHTSKFQLMKFCLRIILQFFIEKEFFDIFFSFALKIKQKVSLSS